MTYIPAGSGLGSDIGVILTATTSGNNPVLVWPGGLAQPWPPRSSYRAFVSAIETTFFAANAHRHFELLGTMQITSEMNNVVTSTEVAADGIAALDAATAIFINNGDSPALELTGVGGADINWSIYLETLVGKL